LDAELQTRLQALGVKPGRVIEVLRRAGVGGPLHVRVGGTEFMLRRQQAAHILVQAQAVVPA
jgi:ferrous iron transport protein A